ncbi:MAG TPA: spermidine/putrescine ABC transporter substrate-binding protein [Mycobacteriales bacterium]|nr:spermidine/putrescine ABC transporter substrate-binding protein [Mycobacteriales bacterium]
MATDPTISNLRLGRRDLFRYAGMGAGIATLAACGVSGEGKTQPTGTALKKQTTSFWDGKKKTGEVNWAQWPLYIDVGKSKGDHPSIDQFTAKTGIKVHYNEVIQDDDTFFAKVQPSLSAGQYSGYDVAVITNGIDFTRFLELDLFVPLEHSLMPNFEKYAGATYKTAAYDPGNVYSVPWQSGITGIAYNTKKVQKPLTSFFDLWDPALKGKVGMFADNEDLPNPMLVAMFGDPAKTGPTQWKAAAKKLNQQRTSGIVRKYYQQDYINALSTGDVWACQAWSGDIFQALESGATDLAFAIPSEGGVLWTDNMVLLKNIKNPVSSMMLIDWFYQPKIAAEVAEYVNYITPVPAAKPIVARDAAAASGSNKKTLQQIATSPLVFPTAADYSKLYRYRTLTNSELTTWNEIFEPVYQS